MSGRDWRYEKTCCRGNGVAVGQRVSGHHCRGPRVRARWARGRAAGGSVGRAGRGRAPDGGPPTQARGPAADRAVRAGRDDRVPAAAQRRRAGGARRHGQPAGGDRAGVLQPAGRGVPGRAVQRPALDRQRGGAGRHRADRRLARARVRHAIFVQRGADRAGRGGAPGDLPHRAEATAGPIHRLRGDRLRHVGRDRVHPALDRVAGAGLPAGRRGGHRLGGLPRPGAVGGRIRAVGLRHGSDGRRAGHRQPLPGAGRRDRNRAGLAGPGSGAGRADRRSDRAGRGRAS